MRHRTGTNLYKIRTVPCHCCGLTPLAIVTPVVGPAPQSPYGLRAARSVDHHIHLGLRGAMLRVVVPEAGFHRMIACRAWLDAPVVVESVMSASVVMLVVPAMAVSSNEVMAVFRVTQSTRQFTRDWEGQTKEEVYAVVMCFLIRLSGLEIQLWVCPSLIFCQFASLVVYLIGSQRNRAVRASAIMAFSVRDA